MIRKYQKIFSTLSLLSLLFNIFFPLFSAASFAQVVHAEDAVVTEAPTPIPAPTEVITPNSIETVTPSAEPVTEPVQTPTITDEPTVTPTSEPTVAPTGQILDGISTQDTPEPTVVLNTPYTFKDTKVSVIFTKLPANPGTLSFKEVKLTPEQIKETGALSDTAYDITSSMIDGTFEYDLTLPLPASAQNKDIAVKSSETESTLNTASTVTEEKQIKTGTITIKKLNHFTVFVVTTGSPASGDAFCIANASNTVTDCFGSLVTALSSAVSGVTIKIANGEYYETGVMIPSTKIGLTIEGESKSGVKIHTSADWGSISRQTILQ